MNLSFNYRARIIFKRVSANNLFSHDTHPHEERWTFPTESILKASVLSCVALAVAGMAFTFTVRPQRSCSCSTFRCLLYQMKIGSVVVFISIHPWPVRYVPIYRVLETKQPHAMISKNYQVFMKLIFGTKIRYSL